MESSSSSTHIVKEQFVPEENRDIASFNADNEFKRATDEENIDLNVPGVPHSTAKQSHGTNVQGLIQKIENRLSDNHCKVIFNKIDNSIFSAKNHKT